MSELKLRPPVTTQTLKTRDELIRHADKLNRTARELFPSARNLQTRSVTLFL